VNLLGERFADESDGNAEDTLNQRLAQQPQGRGFYIIDRDVLESRPILGNDILTKVIVERARAAEAPVIFADTIEDLCRGLVGYGIPERKLLHEIKEFNRLIEADQADDIKPPRRRNRESLRRPPFIAVGVKASITFTMGGLQIDERTRVLRRAGGTSPSVAMPMGRAFMQEDSACLSIGDDYRQMAIEGLYAAGSDTGNISHFSYMGGLAAALTTGCTAGRSAAEFVKKLSK